MTVQMHYVRLSESKRRGQSYKAFCAVTYWHHQQTWTGNLRPNDSKGYETKSFNQTEIHEIFDMTQGKLVA